MYATIEEVDSYVVTYYGSSDTVRTNWEALLTADKQVMLNKAERAIDLLPFHGEPCQADKAFPRNPNAAASTTKVKEATIELALRINSSSEAQERYDLQAQGVKSFKIGDLSETFGDSMALGGIDKFAYDVVYPLLKDWLGGGYRICPTHHKR